MSNETTRRVRPGLLTATDTALVTAAETGTAYLVRDGRREQITHPGQLSAAGIDPRTARRVTIRQDDLDEFPVVHQPSLVSADVGRFDSGEQFLGAGHYMRTWGTLDRASGRVAAQTRTRTVTWFGGYHAGTNIILVDGTDTPVWWSTMHRFGVDGTWIGRSDRTDAWAEQMNSADTARVTGYHVFVSWQPDTFETVLVRWVNAGEKVGKLVTQVAAVAKAASGLFG
jgi:hypothetical protein